MKASNKITERALSGLAMNEFLKIMYTFLSNPYYIIGGAGRKGRGRMP